MSEKVAVLEDQLFQPIRVILKAFKKLCFIDWKNSHLVFERVK